MPFNCPSCERAFETRRGLGVHHSRTHDERLPNRECARCGEKFYCEYERKYCSDSCCEKSVSYAGEDNPNYRGKKETTSCEYCGEEFEYYPSEKRGLYCSSCVREKNWQTLPDVSGENNPQWGGGKLELSCELCDSPVEKYPSNAGEVVICSEDCRRQWLSDSFTGEGHPNWTGGVNEDYGTGWAEVRKTVLERDAYRCVVCGTTRGDLDRNPDVHHIVPVRRFVEHETFDRTDAHTLDNLVSLCPSCHRKAEFGGIAAGRLRWLAATRNE